MYDLIVWQGAPEGTLLHRLQPFFKITAIEEVQQLVDVIDVDTHKVIVVDDSVSLENRAALFLRLKDAEPPIQAIPIILLSSDGSLDKKLEAFEGGADDYISVDVPLDELVARLNKSIFHKIANEQLHNQLKVANEMAFMAMSDTSALGVNIHFLLESINCANIDELGQMLFQALNNYSIKCSLQIRGRYGTKNMEPNGLAKDLEAQLLSELKNAGRYYDFGKRSVMNYGRVSLLVKNMPMDDEKKYGAIKDNVFSLLQGVDARIEALDNQQTLQEERELLELLARRMQTIFIDVDESYQGVIKDIAGVVDKMSEQVENSIMDLGLTESQEKVIESIVEKGVADTNVVFSKGLRMDGELKQLVERVNLIFEFKESPDFHRYMEKIKKSLVSGS